MQTPIPFKIISVILFLLSTGCGSIKPPVDKLAVADQLLKEANAPEVAQFAPLELHLATEKLADAKRAMANDDFLIAERLADEAAADARTAMVKADSLKARQNVDEIKQSIEMLRQELKSKHP